MTQATPYKLKSGAWGAKVQGTVRAGDTVEITARSGKSWTATVDTVVWSGSGVSLVTTASKPRSSGRGRYATHRSPYGNRYGREDCRKYGWDGVVGSSSYYTSGQYDEDS